MLFLYFLLTFFFIVRLALQITVFKTKHFSPEVTHPSFCHRHYPHSHLRPNPCSHICFLFSCSVPCIQFLVPIALSFSTFCQYIGMKVFQHTDTLIGLCSEHICVHHGGVTTNTLLYLLFHIAVCHLSTFCPCFCFYICLSIPLITTHLHYPYYFLRLLLQYIPNASGHQSVGVQTTFWCTGKKC